MDNEGEIFSDETIEGLARSIGVEWRDIWSTRSNDIIARSIGQHSFATGRANRQTEVLRAPFYGLKVVPGITFTMGGVLVNGRAEALECKEKPIPGSTPPAMPSADSWADTAAAIPAD